MTSEKELAANRVNARRSTGPKTAEGKILSSKNALKTGLAAKALLPGEDERDFAAFQQAIAASLQPVGALEEELAARIGSCLWRLRRVPRIEAEIFDQLGILASSDHEAASRPNPFKMKKHRELEASFARGLERPSAAFLTAPQHGDPIAKLIRYETALDRAMHRAVLNLERLQAARRDGVALEAVTIEQRADPKN